MNRTLLAVTAVLLGLAPAGSALAQVVQTPPDFPRGRISGYIFGDGGTNFLSTFIERAQSGARLKAINDSFGTPTYAPHLAERFCQLVTIDLPGLYHVVNAGEGVSFAQFVESAFGMMGLDYTAVESVSTDSLTRPAPRPRNSRLHCLMSEAIGLKEMPHWADGLREFVAAKPSVLATTQLSNQ